MEGRRRAALCCLASAMLASVLAGQGPTLTQLPGTAGCVSENGTGGQCVDGHHLEGPNGIAVSPDGRNVYLTSGGSSAMLIFDRDRDTGQIALLPLDQGCVSQTGVASVCADGVALDSVGGVAVSPDGRNVYTVSFGDSAVAVFDRDQVSGAVMQKALTDACVSDDGSSGSCVNGVELVGAAGIAISPNGAHVYVAAFGSDSVSIFDRDPATGKLTQKASTDGCVSETGSTGACADGNALNGAVDVAVSPNGSNVYVASLQSSAIAVFDRDLTTGELTQKAGLAGCVSETGTETTCTDGRGLSDVRNVRVSPDGRNVYAGAPQSNAVVVFDRDPTTGVLTQKAGTAGCISDNGTGGDCTDGLALSGALGVALSPNGESVYVTAIGPDAVAVFDRDTTGALSQKAGTGGCVSNTGNGGLCALGRALDGTSDVVVSPDGKTVYALADTSNAIAIFDRSPAPYDIDGDGEVDALTDAILLLRYTFDFTGAILIADAVDLVNCARCTAADIEAFLDSLAE